jgi:Family of unknown function (DUF6186)
MSARALTVLGFSCLTLAVVVAQARAALAETRTPTLGEVLGYLMRTRAGRVGVLLSWWWLGWHFFAR